MGKSPLRISMDRDSQINDSHNICNTEARTIIFRNHTIEQIIDELYTLGIQSVMVEGGEWLLNELISKDLFDEIWEFVSPMNLNQMDNSAKGGVRAPRIDGVCSVDTQSIGSVKLNRYVR